MSHTPRRLEEYVAQASAAKLEPQGAASPNWTVAQLTDMHLDGFEMFNLHRNALKNGALLPGCKRNGAVLLCCHK